MHQSPTPSQFIGIRILPGIVMPEVTQLLRSLEDGQSQAAEKLLPVVYDELRKLAARRLANENPGQTLQATALLHEAWIMRSMPLPSAKASIPSDRVAVKVVN